MKLTKTEEAYMYDLVKDPEMLTIYTYINYLEQKQMTNDGFVKCSMRLIEQNTGIDKMKVARKLKKLNELGLVGKGSTPNGTLLFIGERLEKVQFEALMEKGMSYQEIINKLLKYQMDRHSEMVWGMPIEEINKHMESIDWEEKKKEFWGEKVK